MPESLTIPSVHGPLSHPSDEVSLLDAVTPVVQRWRWVLAWPLALGVLAAAASFVLPPQYTARTTFTPIATSAGGLAGLSGQAGLAGLAGQLGLGMPGANTSPDYFADVLRSREILTKTLLASFADSLGGRGDESSLLIDIMRIEGATRAQRLSDGIRKLDESLRIQVDGKTGIVALEVRQRSPRLAAAVANRIVAELNTFNLERRQSQSRAQREFTQDRLRQAEAELRDAEQAQLRFLETNRRYSESPVLAFQANRLERTVQLKQEVFLRITNAYEEARIAEVRDTPVLTIIDPAIPPIRRTSPRRTLFVLVAMFVGLFVGVVGAQLSDLARRLRQNRTPDYEAFTTAWNRARGELAAIFWRR